MLKPSLSKKLTGREVALMNYQNVMDVLSCRAQTFSESEIEVAENQLKEAESQSFQEWIKAALLIESLTDELRSSLYEKSFWIAFFTNLLNQEKSEAKDEISRKMPEIKDGIRLCFEIEAIANQFTATIGRETHPALSCLSILVPTVSLYHFALESGALTGKATARKDHYIDLEALRPSNDFVEKIGGIFSSFPNETWEKSIGSLLKA